MSWLSGIKISARISGGFAALLLVLLGLSGFAYLLLTGFDHSFVQYRTLARDSNLTAETEIDVIKARLNLKEFLLNGKDETKKTILAFFHETETLIAKAEGQITDPERVRLISGMKTGLLAYENAFAQVARLIGENRRIKTEVLDVNGPAMEQELTEIMRTAKLDGDADAAVNAGETLRALLLARLYVQRYEVSHDAASAERVRAEFAAVDKHLARLERELSHAERRRLAADAKKQFGTYRSGFEDKTRTTTELYAIIGRDLDPNGRKITDLADQVRKDVQGDQDKLGPKVLADVKQGERVLLMVSFAGFLCAAALAFVIGRSIAKPVGAITGVMRALAAGEIAVPLPQELARGRDEVAEMARAVEVFRRNAIEAAALAGEQEALKLKVEAEKRKVLNDLADRFEGEVMGVARAVAAAAGQLESDAHAMGDAAAGTNEQSAAVAAVSHETSTNMQTVASAAEELTASIGEIGMQVTKAASAGGQAADEARTAGGIVQNLAASVQRIGEVVELINQIASQTNLLALNATIEAARAGEAGRGFAVVAQEVKSLANQTAKSTGEIATQIGAVQTATREVVRAIDSVTGTIGDVSGVSTAIAASVQEQSAAVEEIARNVAQAAQGSEAVTVNITGVNRSAAETGEVAGQIVQASNDLTRQAEALTQHIGTFLRQVRVG